MNRRLGIVASAGGSVIFEVLPYLRANGIELVVATDRACGIEERCAAQGILHQRFAYHERDAFSQAVQHFFVQHEVALVLLYTFSTLYHSLRGQAKSILQKLDHHRTALSAACAAK